MAREVARRRGRSRGNSMLEYIHMDNMDGSGGGEGKDEFGGGDSLEDRVGKDVMRR